MIKTEVLYILDFHNFPIGIDEMVKKKMMLIKFSKTGQDKIIEFKFNKDDNSGARYGMIALGRSEDNKLVDCMYVMLKIDFKLAPKESVIKKQALSPFWLMKLDDKESGKRRAQHRDRNHKEPAKFLPTEGFGRVSEGEAYQLNQLCPVFGGRH